MPANRLKLQRIFRFVLDCVMDERFTPDAVVGFIDAKGGGLGPIDRMIYRTQVVPRTRETVLEMSARVGILMGDRVTPWGPGRVDTFNPYKAMQFHWNLEQLAPEELIGASDYPSLWNQKPREGLHLHWDGNNDSLAERNLSAALGAGVTPVTADYAAINRVRDWISTLPPPKYPFPIDAAKAAKGEPVYRKYCGDCHGDGRFGQGVLSGKWLGEVTPLADIGTDAYRFRSYTFEFSENQYTLYPSTEHRFTHFRKTDGYANHPLDGLWLRAPFLHNGAVPTLRDLLEPAEARPKKFYRGYDVYDPVKVGFVSNVATDGGEAIDVYDTSLPGNGNAGHGYGTELPDDDKEAVVEYLKTF